MSINWNPTPTANRSLSLNPMLNASQGMGFVVTTNFITVSTAATETPLLYLNNTSSNSISIASFLKKYSSLNGDYAQFKHYANPTISANGTGLSIVNLRSNSSSPASVMNAYVSPTVSANGTLVSIVSTDFIMQTDEIPYIIDPGNSILITATVQTNNDKVTAEWAWWELNI